MQLLNIQNICLNTVHGKTEDSGENVKPVFFGGGDTRIWRVLTYGAYDSY